MAHLRTLVVVACGMRALAVLAELRFRSRLPRSPGAAPPAWSRRVAPAARAGMPIVLTLALLGAVLDRPQLWLAGGGAALLLAGMRSRVLWWVCRWVRYWLVARHTTAAMLARMMDSQAPPPYPAAPPQCAGQRAAWEGWWGTRCCCLTGRAVARRHRPGDGR